MRAGLVINRLGNRWLSRWSFVWQPSAVLRHAPVLKKLVSLPVIIGIHQVGFPLLLGTGTGSRALPKPT